MPIHSLCHIVTESQNFQCHVLGGGVQCYKSFSSITIMLLCYLGLVPGANADNRRWVAGPSWGSPRWHQGRLLWWQTAAGSKNQSAAKTHQGNDRCLQWQTGVGVHRENKAGSQPFAGMMACLLELYAKKAWLSSLQWRPVHYKHCAPVCRMWSGTGMQGIQTLWDTEDQLVCNAWRCAEAFEKGWLLSCTPFTLR